MTRRRSRNWPQRLGAGVVFLLAAYPGGAVLGALWTAPGADPRDHACEVDVRLIAGPIHYDILLPATPETRADFAFATAARVPIEDPREQWIATDWGARDFYTSVRSIDDLTLKATWRSVTGDSAVLHTDVAGPLPPGRPARRLCLSAARFERLRQSILADVMPDTKAQ